MRKLIMLFSLAILLSSTAIANTSSLDGKTPETLKEQLLDYLDNMDLRDAEDAEKVYVDFMINPKGEILVLGTNNITLDKKIKNRLNYKKVINHQLEYNKVYTLPIKFKAK